MYVLLKLAAVFAIIVLLLSRKVKLGYVMLIASAALGLLFQASVRDIIKELFKTIAEWETISLILLLSLIMILEKMMSRKELMSKMVSALRHTVGDYRLTSLLLPALIGLLPSAGGAIFSAPMVNEVCHDTELSAEKKSFINYWYRHIWEMVFPIYTALIIASGILKLPISALISRFYPYTIITILAGLPFTYFRMPKNHTDKPKEIGKNLFTFLRNFSPILMILLLYFIFKVPLALGVLAAIILLTGVMRIHPMEYVDLMKKDFNFSIIATLIGVLYFKNMLVVTDVVNQIPQIFGAMGVPNLLVAAVFPFIVGLLGGMDSVFVAVTLPIIASLGGQMDMSLITVAYVFGRMGVMLSPLHLCLTLTVEYFNANFNKVLLRVALGQSIVVLFALIIYFIK